MRISNLYVRGNAAWALGQIDTPEALKAVEEYQSQQQYADGGTYRRVLYGYQ